MEKYKYIPQDGFVSSEHFAATRQDPRDILDCELFYQFILLKLYVETKNYWYNRFRLLKVLIFLAHLCITNTCPIHSVHS